MDTNNDRANQQGQNFGDMENVPNDMATPQPDNKPGIDIDKINDDFLANDENDSSGTETGTGTASQRYEKQDYQANDRGRNPEDEDTAGADSPGTL